MGNCIPTAGLSSHRARKYAFSSLIACHMRHCSRTLQSVCQGAGRLTVRSFSYAAVTMDPSASLTTQAAPRSVSQGMQNSATEAHSQSSRSSCRLRGQRGAQKNSLTEDSFGQAFSKAHGPPPKTGSSCISHTYDSQASQASRASLLLDATPPLAELTVKHAVPSTSQRGCQELLQGGVLNITEEAVVASRASESDNSCACMPLVEAPEPCNPISSSAHDPEDEKQAIVGMMKAFIRYELLFMLLFCWQLAVQRQWLWSLW